LAEAGLHAMRLVLGGSGRRSATAPPSACSVSLNAGLIGGV
jgi:hypothetical protein